LFGEKLGRKTQLDLQKLQEEEREEKEVNLEKPWLCDHETCLKGKRGRKAIMGWLISKCIRCIALVIMWLLLLDFKN